MTDTLVRKRSITIAGHRTSISMEQPFWKALQEIATLRGQSMSTVITEIDAQSTGNLSSAIRLFVLAQYQSGALHPKTS